jgi:hypothetical protein
MPYDGEFAAYRALQRITEADRVKQLLRRAKVFSQKESSAPIIPSSPPPLEDNIPGFVVAIDGSYQEIRVKTGYPGARVGYLTVASVLLDLLEIRNLDNSRPVDPVAFRRTEEANTIDAALPGCNVITRTHMDARTAFREELFDIFHSSVIDPKDESPLLETYEALLSLKPRFRSLSCPYRRDHDCTMEHLKIPSGLSTCPCDHRRTIWSTDALRIHERFNDNESNGEAFGLVMQVLERLLLVHILRAFERLRLLDRANRLAFFIDGPLAVFGPPAWLSASISSELKRINAKVRELTGRDLVIIGVEKTGTFVSHFDELDNTEDPGVERFGARTYFLPTDNYIKQRIVYSDSVKPYGSDTYFGRKFFYKTSSGARIVASIPFLDAAQDTIETDDISIYPSFGTVCSLLDDLASSRFPNALSPLVSAHAHAAIPLNLGSKVLEQLAKALMREV